VLSRRTVHPQELEVTVTSTTAPSRSKYRAFIEDLRDTKLKALRLEQGGSYDFTEIKRDLDTASGRIDWSISRRQVPLNRAKEAISLYESAANLERLG
jgi:hypothetical protein